MKMLANPQLLAHHRVGQDMAIRPKEGTMVTLKQIGEATTTIEHPEDETAIKLTIKTTTKPDFNGWKFYVEHGDDFDHRVFEAGIGGGLVLTEEQRFYVDSAVEDLVPGEWLHVDYTVGPGEPQ